MGRDEGWYPSGGKSGVPSTAPLPVSQVFTQSQPVLTLLQATILKWGRGCQLLAGPGGSLSIHLRKKGSHLFLTHRAEAKSPGKTLP